jgi:hypothetical protein
VPVDALLELSGHPPVDVPERRLRPAPAGGLEPDLRHPEEPGDDALADIDVLDPVQRDLPRPARDDAGGDVERVGRQLELEPLVVRDGPGHPGQPGTRDADAGNRRPEPDVDQ